MLNQLKNLLMMSNYLFETCRGQFDWNKLMSKSVLNALRRRFQWTKDNEELRTQRRIQYTEAKKNYAAKIRKAKRF
jgi:hypothetical protein